MIKINLIKYIKISSIILLSAMPQQSLSSDIERIGNWLYAKADNGACIGFTININEDHYFIYSTPDSVKDNMLVHWMRTPEAHLMKGQFSFAFSNSKIISTGVPPIEPGINEVPFDPILIGGELFQNLSSNSSLYIAHASKGFPTFSLKGSSKILNLLVNCR